MDLRMTREEYEQHLLGLGSWAELMPPWEVMCPQEEDRLLRAARRWGQVWLNERDQAEAIARALLQETSLTPSQVRERWPEEAEWLLD